MNNNSSLRRLLAGIFTPLALLVASTESHAFFGVDIRTTTTSTSDIFADRLFSATPNTKAPSGTRIWIVLDVAGNGVPQNPLAGAILGPDDQIIAEDMVPGQLPPTFLGRYVRNGVLIADDSLRDKTNVFVYVWDYYETTNSVPHYEPPAGARYGIARLSTTPVPAVGNAKWRIYTDVFANSLTVGGGVTRPTISGVSAQTTGPDLILSFNFPTAAGVSYQVQTATNLSAAPISWVNEGGAIPGTGSAKNFSSTNNISTLPIKFYRVVAN